MRNLFRYQIESMCQFVIIELIVSVEQVLNITLVVT